MNITNYTATPILPTVRIGEIPTGIPFDGLYQSYTGPFITIGNPMVKVLIRLTADGGGPTWTGISNDCSIQHYKPYLDHELILRG